MKQEKTGERQTDSKYFSMLIATKNPGKVRELGALLAGVPVRLRSLKEFEPIADVAETGSTFAENAELKATAYARTTGLWTVADDSGLAVEALGGAPGVYSARYAGPAAADAVNVAKLLSALEAVGDANRRAAFVCVMAVSDETGTARFTAEGRCSGTIAAAPRGSGGFGYDPVFVPDGYTKTFGELSDETKHEISHRARAAEKIIQYLRDFIAI